MSRGFSISITHNTPRRRKRHIRHTTLEMIDSVYSFMTKLPKKNFNFLWEVIHPNNRINFLSESSRAPFKSSIIDFVVNIDGESIIHP